MTYRDKDIPVLVPTLNEADQILPLLDHLGDFEFGEIIVSDGGSVDGTPDLVRKRGGVTLISGLQGRGSQLGAAVAASKSAFILMLHADTRLPHRADDIIRAALAADNVAGGCFNLRFYEGHPVLAASAWFTRFDTVLTSFGDQAFFMRRDKLREAGGVPDTPVLEDVALRLRLRRVGRFVKTNAIVVTSGRRLIRRGVMACQVQNAIILIAYGLGVSPHRLACWYQPEPPR